MGSQRFDLFLLITDAGYEQAGVGRCLYRLGESLHQSGHILDRVNAGGNAVDHIAFIPVKSQALQVLLPGAILHFLWECHAVVDGPHPVCVIAPQGHALLHGVADRHPAVPDPQGNPVEQTDRPVCRGTAHVVQAGIGMDGGDDGAACLSHQHGHHIGLGAMAVEHIKVLIFQVLFQISGHMEHAPLFQDTGIDARLPGFLGKGALHEADQLHIVVLAQLLQQADHMGFRAAHVAAGDQMHDFHRITPA